MNAAGSYVLEFETERLRVRPLNASNEALYRELYTDPKVMRHIAPPLSAERASSSFRKVLALQSALTLKWRFLVIEERETLQSVGICGTSNYDAAALRLEVGIVLKLEAGARGLGREVLRGLVEKIFGVSQIAEIWVKCSTLHSAAERMISAVGFNPCGNEIETTGELSKRVWSVGRSSWCVDQSIIPNRQIRESACRI